MKNIFFLFFTAFLLAGCIEVTESQPPNTSDGMPNVDLNESPPADSNNQADLNVSDDQNVSEVPPTPPLPGELTIEYCDSLENETKTDSCTIDLAVQELDTSYCLNLKVLSQDNCIFDVAKQSLKLSDCLLIKKEPIKESCISLVEPTAVASECTVISDSTLREDCYFNQATAQSNYNICALISGSIRQNQYLRDKCLDQVYASFIDQEVCSLYFSAEKKEQCIFDIAIKNLSIETCKQVTNETSSNICIKDVSIQLNNQSGCNEISDDTLQQQCLEYFAENSPLVETCQNITNITLKKQCFKEVAISNLDDSICDLILDKASDVQTTCYLEIGKQTFEIQTCHKIYPYAFSIKDECYSIIALEKLEFSACEEVHLPANYISCFSSIATDINNFGICDQMKKDFFSGLGFNPKYGCYKEFAIAISSTTICELIGPSNIRQDCLAEVNAQ